MKKYKKDLIAAWMQADSSLIYFYAELFEYLMTAVHFCWTVNLTLVPDFYANFALPLKSLIVLYDFLYKNDEEFIN